MSRVVGRYRGISVGWPVVRFSKIWGAMHSRENKIFDRKFVIPEPFPLDFQKSGGQDTPGRRDFLINSFFIPGPFPPDFQKAGGQCNPGGRNFLIIDFLIPGRRTFLIKNVFLGRREKFCSTIFFFLGLPSPVFQRSQTGRLAPQELWNLFLRSRCLSSGKQGITLERRPQTTILRSPWASSCWVGSGG